MLFYANLGPNNGATSPKQRLGLFSWGLLGKTGNFRPRRTWEYEQRSARPWRFRPCMSQPYEYSDLNLNMASKVAGGVFYFLGFDPYPSRLNLNPKYPKPQITGRVCKTRYFWPVCKNRYPAAHRLCHLRI